MLINLNLIFGVRELIEFSKEVGNERHNYCYSIHYDRDGVEISRTKAVLISKTIYG